MKKGNPQANVVLSELPYGVPRSSNAVYEALPNSESVLATLNDTDEVTPFSPLFCAVRLTVDVGQKKPDVSLAVHCGMAASLKESAFVPESM